MKIINNDFLNSVKNLKLIYFYPVYENTDALGLKVIFGNNEIISMDYRNENFDTYVNYIKKLYDIEKNTHEIYIDDFSLNYIESYNIKEIENMHYQNNPIVELSRFHIKTKIIEDYIIATTKNILSSIFFKDEIIQITQSNGYKNKYCVEYDILNSLGDIKESSALVFLINEVNNNKYICNTNYIYNNLFNLEMTIEFLNNCVKITWNDLDNTFVGRNLNYVDNNNNTNIIKINIGEDEEYIYLPQNKLSIDNKKFNQINFYANICNIYDLRNITSYFNNQFMGQKILLEADKFNNQYYHISLKENLIRIDYINEIGFLKENNFKLITAKTEANYTLLKFNFDNRQFILRQMLPLDGEQQRYNYRLFEVNNDLKIINESEIQEDVVEIDNIKKLIK